MPEIEIKTAKQEDLESMLAIDHSVQSNYAFQMDIDQNANNISVSFRNVKLPRTALVKYPKNEEQLLFSWQKASVILVGWINGGVVAYLGLEELPGINAIKVRDLVVAKDWRRQGIASGMLLASEDWALKRNNTTILIEVQSRNHPAISMARKLGYQFCGFQDHFFPNKDVAIFFHKVIR